MIIAWPVPDSCFNLPTIKLLCFCFFPASDASVAATPAATAADGSVPDTPAAANGMLPSLFSLSSC